MAYALIGLIARLSLGHTLTGLSNWILMGTRRWFISGCIILRFGILRGGGRGWSDPSVCRGRTMMWLASHFRSSTESCSKRGPMTSARNFIFHNEKLGVGNKKGVKISLIW